MLSSTWFSTAETVLISRLQAHLTRYQGTIQAFEPNTFFSFQGKEEESVDELPNRLREL